MKKIIINSILFLLLTSVFYFLVLFFLSNVRLKGRPLYGFSNEYFILPGGHTYLRFQEWEEMNKDYDYLVFGSSLAYRGVDPRNFESFGLSAFNLGSSAQSMSDTYIIFKNYVQPEAKAIIVVSPGAFETEGVESSLRLIPNIKNNEVKSELAFSKFDMRLVNEYWVNQLSFQDYAREYDAKEEGKYISGGYCSKIDTSAETIEITPVFHPRRRQLLAFDQLLHEIAELRIETYLVIPPIKESKTSRLKTASFKIHLENYVHAHDYVNLIDCSHLQEIHDDEHFSDHSHLNQAGVDIFNQKLLEKLKGKH